ncbi:MAG: hypothetical protein EBW59_03020 [Betaproteobacteria bacterium]|nr:hypothetical protein [Betaproteobacteria bacterium]
MDEATATDKLFNSALASGLKEREIESAIRSAYRRSPRHPIAQGVNPFKVQQPVKIEMTPCPTPSHHADDVRRFLLTAFNEGDRVCIVRRIHACKNMQRNQTGTWIDSRIIASYTKLHQMGYTHSFEVYNLENALVGGIYGMLTKTAFFGESMFHLENNASKVCFYYLCRWLKDKGIGVIDAQVKSEHISQWGGELISRDKFMDIIM